MRNVDTLLGSDRGRPGVCSAGQWANRKDGLTPQEDKMPHKAKAASRKATGIHNRADGATRMGPREWRDPARKGADVGQGTNQPRAVNTDNGGGR